MKIHFLKSKILPALFLTLILLSGFLVIKSFYISTKEYTDPEDYQSVLQSMNYPQEKLIAHFPDRIPSNVENVQFFYRPKFLQGGGALQLRFKTSHEEVEKFLTKFEPLSIHVQQGCTDLFDAINQGSQVAIASFRNEGNTGFGVLPKDYKVIVLGSKPYHEKDWNHGYSYGVAVSVKRNEVVYWSEFW